MNTIEEIKNKNGRLPSRCFIAKIHHQHGFDALESKIRVTEIQFKMLVLPEQLLLYRKTEAELGVLYKQLMEMVADNGQLLNERK